MYEPRYEYMNSEQNVKKEILIENIFTYATGY